MEYLVLILGITIIHFLAVLSPGPDFVMTVRHALVYGRKAGIFTAFGLSLGVIIHITYCLLGIGFIISQSILAFTLIKFLGAGYLIYIGIRSFFAKKSHINIDDKPDKKNLTNIQAIKLGFFTNILNPKATLYFLSVFTFSISPEFPLWVTLIVSFMMILIVFLWFSMLAIFFTNPKIRVGFHKAEGFFNKMFGGLLVALGLKVALSTNS